MMANDFLNSTFLFCTCRVGARAQVTVCKCVIDIQLDSIGYMTSDLYM